MKERSIPHIHAPGVLASGRSVTHAARSAQISEALGKVSQSSIRISGREKRSIPANFVGANQIGLAQALANAPATILQNLAASIVESSDDAIVSKDLDGIIMTWNRGAEQLFGYTADEVIGKPVTILIPAECQEEEPEILARIRRDERIGHYETVRRKDGSLVAISLTVSPIHGSNGEIIGASKIARDITDRKRAEAALAASEMRFRELNQTLEQRVEAQARERDRVWNVSQDLLVVADSGGTYLSVNPAWTTVLGWSESELLSKTGEWLVHPDDRERTSSEIANLATGGKTLHFGNRLRQKGGSYRWLSWTAVPDRGKI